MWAPIQAVEAFHLAFLRIAEARLDRSSYVVKGGVNLRGWFGSQRYSEDLDLDVLRGEVFELKERVDGLLGAAPFARLLKTLGIEITRTSRPKQTETTQRWKFGLRAAGTEVEFHTKVEFSRRGSDDEFVLEPALLEVVRPYGIPAPSANHYTARSAIRQKILALASRREPQARDVWDLDHLFHAVRDEKPLLDVPPSVAELPAAVDRVLEMPYERFRAHVVPYLEPDAQELYGSKEGWRRIQEHVFQRLAELNQP
jgi:hypothetical protein